MKYIAYLSVLWLSLFALSSCSDDDSADGGSADGKVRLELASPSPSVVTTRATSDTETIENVAVFVFKSDGTKTNGFTLTSSENIQYIDLYLSDDDDAVYAVCNHPNAETLVENVNTLSDLQSKTLTISTADGAHPGHYVMTGHTTVAAINKAIEDGETAEIPVYRLAAHLNITIKVNTSTDDDNGGDGGDFKLTNVYICNVPKGSNLLRSTEDENSAAITGSCTSDYTYKADADEMRANYFSSYLLSTQEESGAITAEFDLFENRRGSITDEAASWPELTGLESHEKYRYYKQLYKRNRAIDYPSYINQITIGQEVSNETLETDETTSAKVKAGQFYNATYLRIDGVYQRTNGSTYKTSYYVYLGGDNYKDFNIRRNYWYNHEITIKAHDDYDHRVTGELLGGLTVYASLDDPLDAHCNVVKALMYAPEEWTVSVKDPDNTPWLEVSKSAVYKPRLAGQATTGDEAAFSISGTRGLTYFYIHTDDYIPDIDTPEQNSSVQTRTGTIVCRSKNVTQELTVTQLPAQLVILYIKFDLLTFGAVRDTFFIERKLEQKYMPWGFYHYWSFETDNMISTGTWDGLSNTRRLYNVGLYGQKKKNGDQLIAPAYPTGLPYDHAIGYITQKNRDRNGNGQIDYNEIMWYWPATKELKQIYETKAYLSFEGSETQFHASTPSGADPGGVTPGLSYSVKMSDGKTHIVRRDRMYNVIACRRKNAWRGPDDAGAGGNVDLNPDWDDGDEVIIPQAK